MTQRMEGFRGGVQIGTSATSPSSASLESIVRRTLDSLEFAPGYIHLSNLSGETYKNMIKSNLDSEMPGMSPDGGMLFKEDLSSLIYASECKYQGLKGNAIERWLKNALMANNLGVQRYTTFCAGEGFFDKGTAHRILAVCAASLDPSMEQMWGNAEGRWGFYRFRTIEEADREIPLILQSELSSLSLISQERSV